VLQPLRCLSRALTTVSAVVAASLGSISLSYAQIDPGPVIKVNQVAYVPGTSKLATVVNSSSTPLPWTLRNSAGATVASGQTTVRGLDTLSGDNTHVIDFSSFDTVAAGYVLSVAGANSAPFDISADAVRRLRYDALAFFYHQRSGTPILAEHVTSRYARPAGHINVSPNRGDNAVPCRTDCGYTLDVRGGWYDAGDHGKYVVNGGISTWQLINAYERTLYVTGADSAALGDGKLAIPERANGVPDILDEARWEVEFLLKMQVPDGRTNAGMAHHKIHDQNWTALPTRPEADSQARLLSPVSTAATLNLAAVAAQAARVWRNIDPAFSSRALTAAEKAYAAAKANPSRLASPNDGTGGGAYSDNNVNDEFYWAAAELYVTTGSATYRSDLTGSSFFRGASFTTGGYDWGATAGLGDTTLALVPNGLPAADIAATRAALVSFADRQLNLTSTQGYPAFAATYNWGSNSTVLNNAIVVALAFDFTGQQKYRTGVYQALDYLLGRNPYNYSYVSGYGERAAHNQHHRFWANQLNGSLPNPPPGSLAGGPNAALQDPVAQQRLTGCRPQKCYLDDIEAFSLNEVAINWNAPLAWVAAWAAEKAGGGGTTPTDTPPSTPGTPTASGITATSASLSWAASTDDNGVAGYDILRIQGTAQSLLATAISPPATLSNLTASTDYTVAIRARDGSGQLSALSPSASFRTSGGTTTPPPGSCRVQYTPNSWNTGFTATVTLTNTGTASWSGWTLQFSFANGQRVTSFWESVITQPSGSAAVTVTNAPHNGTVAPGGTASFGFQGTHNGTNTSPTAFTVNGQACN
jgi:endoglucanase